MFQATISLSFIGIVATAPILNTTSPVVSDIIDDFPVCARSAMTEMLSLGPTYGCANVNGNPDLHCICIHKQFKSVTKSRVLSSCPDPADIDTAKEVATRRCVTKPSFVAW
ncbi:uncharacterized protein B0T15DRAFT_549706 [Chaetomium strumarium]|uniref:CFEM domain-containing protein n=1 Tax=Chaetomium strumarium TaxID=1170767 RepID=A0AAJ0M3M5_9PEZI|nr:hypothetical protein B0T15DRAFT_549706 [Chaetomium strumarium]